MNDSIKFDAPWDGRLIAATVIVGALLCGSIAMLIWLALARIPMLPLRIFLLADALVLAGVFVACALLGPRRYSIEGASLRIDRPIGAIEIPLASIREAGILPAEKLKGAWRTLGAGGFFGYYGRFRSKELGNFRMYATRSDGHVLVRADLPYVLTPDSPAGLVAELQRRGVKQAGTSG
jgi:hypothetical protein